MSKRSIFLGIYLLAGAALLSAPALAESCGQAVQLAVGPGFNQIQTNGSAFTAIMIDSLPVGSSTITLAANPVDSGPNVIYTGPVAAGQRINLPRILGFYIKVPGTGGQISYRMCHA